MANTPRHELDLARLRFLGRQKPSTKAGQVRQAWPEIRQLLAAGHTLKDICTWLNEIGIQIGYARLSDYVNQLRRNQSEPNPAAAPHPITDTVSVALASDLTVVEQEHLNIPKKRDPLANIRRSEASRPGFQYRPATTADEKDLI